jgi:hypothetical protein
VVAVSSDGTCMKWLLALLILGNGLFWGYTQLAKQPSVDFSHQQINAEQMRVVGAATATLANAASQPTGTASKTPEATPKPESEPAKPAPEKPVEPTPAVPASPQVVSAESTPAKALACYRLSVAGANDVARLQQRLATLDLGERLKSDITGEASKYWVYVPPRDTLEAAQKKAAEIKSLGVNDYYIIQDKGRWDKAISLGIFSTAEGANKHLENLQAKGVKSAQVRPRDEVVKQGAFTITQADAGLAAKLSKLQSQFAGSKLIEASCE